MRPLSHSSISMYAECPLKYKFKYVDKLPEKPKYFFSFGRSVHSALEFFYNIPALPAPSLDQVLGHYKQHWVREGYKDPGQEQEHFEEGERILREFYRRHIGAFRPPFFAEYRFDLKVDGVPVLGFIDRIDKVSGERLAVVDYKTGKAFSSDRVKTDAQLTMYQMACEELLGLQVESLTFYHLNSLTPYTTGPRSRDQIEELRGRIVRTAKDIGGAKFEPKPDEWKCKWCDFQASCPALRGFVAPAARAEAPLPSPRPGEDQELAALVDRYGRLTDEAARVAAEADQAAAALADLLRARGWVRAFGDAYEAALSPEERWEFPDKAGVLDVIKRAGRWEDILAPSAPLVRKLMDDSTLPPELRSRLETLGRKVSRNTLRAKRIE